jgi:heme-degrading monooxygenase HmoA
VIARLWSADARPGQAPAYVEHLRTQVLPALRAIDGYAGATLLLREAADLAEIIVITMWRSLDAIRAFAGPDFEVAVVADDAVARLIRFDRRVRHYEVAVTDDGVPGGE